MDLQQLELLVKQGESKTLEFKTSTAKLQAAFDTLCGFLNGYGGTVLIGVKDNHQIVGQDVTDNTRLEIANEIKKIEPSYPVEVEYIPITGNKFVIRIHVHQGQHAPYIYDSRPFQRTESGTSRMSQHRYEQLLMQRGQLNYSWEDAPALGYTIADLDHEEIYKTVADGIRENRIPASAQTENVMQILERLELINGDHLKRAAVVLYARQDAKKTLQCMIKMARFEGVDKLGNFIDNQQIQGNSFKLLSEADIFIRRHLAIASSFSEDQFKRIDKPTLPVLAVREALINAICHRDYSDQLTDISLAIYDDRLEIWNSGELLKNLTVENLKNKHDSILRNNLIAHVFYLRGFIEKWGIGTNKMVMLCQQYGVPEPMFIERSGGLEVVFKFPEAMSMNSISVNIHKTLLTARQNDIIKLLQKNKNLSTRDIHNFFESTASFRTISADLSILKKHNMVEQHGNGRSITWSIPRK